MVMDTHGRAVQPSRPSAPVGARGRAPGTGAQARVARAWPPYCHSAGRVSGLMSST